MTEDIARPTSPWRRRQRLAPYLFVAPFLLLFAVFFLWPLVSSAWMSLQKTAGPRRSYFIGLDNYRFLLRDRYFWFSVANTLAFAGAFLLVQIPASLGLAVLLNSRRIIGRRGLRLAFFSTHLVGASFVGVIFAQLLNPRHGLVNAVLSILTGSPMDIDWLGTPSLAMVSVLIAALWLSIGYGMVYYLAALQGVQPQLYEAAAVDGAGRWQRFWHITLPGVRPVTGFLAMVGFLWAIQTFELPYVLFGQSAGPGNAATTIVMYLYLAGFQVGDFGYAAAIGWMLVLLSAGGVALQWRRARRGVVAW